QGWEPGEPSRLDLPEEPHDVPRAGYPGWHPERGTRQEGRQEGCVEGEAVEQASEAQYALALLQTGRREPRPRSVVHGGAADLDAIREAGRAGREPADLRRRQQFGAAAASVLDPGEP